MRKEQKWIHSQAELRKDFLVVIKVDILPPTLWRLARVAIYIQVMMDALERLRRDWGRGRRKWKEKCLRKDKRLRKAKWLGRKLRKWKRKRNRLTKKWAWKNNWKVETVEGISEFCILLCKEEYKYILNV